MLAGFWCFFLFSGRAGMLGQEERRNGSDSMGRRAQLSFMSQ
jgi:hypothetical protein